MKDTVWIASVPYLFLSPDCNFPGWTYRFRRYITS